MPAPPPPRDRLPERLRSRFRASGGLPREVYVLGLIAFCVAVGFGVLVPVLPVFARSFGVDNFAVGAVVSAFAALRLVTSPFCGRLIDRFGERLVMAVGIFIVAASSGVAGISQTYEQLLVLRGIGGVGSAMFTVSATTLLLTSVEAGLRGRAAGFFQGGFLLGGMTGPAIGGVLSAIALRRTVLLLRRHPGRGRRRRPGPAAGPERARRTPPCCPSSPSGRCSATSGTRRPA